MKIEEYIKAHRIKLDVDEPDENMIWETIRDEMYRNKFRKFYNYLKITASILLILSVSTFFLLRKKAPLYQISYQLGKKEKAYIEAVNIKMKETNFKQLNRVDDNYIIKYLIEELHYTDTIYKEVMNDIEESGYLEESVEILFDTYEKKIELLERIYLETQKNNNHEKDKEKIVL